MIDFINHTGFVDIAFVALVLLVGTTVFFELKRRRQERRRIKNLRLDDDFSKYILSLRKGGARRDYDKLYELRLRKNEKDYFC